MSQFRRLFLALEIPDVACEQVAGLQDRLKTGCRFIDAHPKWSPLDNLHITLIFLGDTDKKWVPELIELSDASAASIPAFDVELRRVDLFPPGKAPKVISLGVGSEGKMLRKLHGVYRDNLVDSGYTVETRSYKPHLTLARLTSTKTASRVGPLVASHSSLPAIKFPVNEVVLFESRLGDGPPVYTPLHRSKLADPADETP